MTVFGLVIKDITLVKKSFGWYHIFPIVVLVISCMQIPDLLSMVLSASVFFIASNLVLTSLTLDFQYHWESTVRSLPVSPRQVVVSKYLCLFVMLIIATLLLVIIEIVLVFIFNMSHVVVLFSIAFGLSFTLAYCALMFPVLYRYGPNKMQIATITYVAIMALVLTCIGAQDFSNVVAVLSSDMALLVVVGPVSTLVFIVASIPLSTLLSNRAFKLK